MPDSGVKTGSSSKKCSDSKVKKNQRQQKCYPLEPVLENSVAHLDESASRGQLQCGDEGKGRCKRKGIMTRLRDGYERVMNDMASGAGLTLQSAAYHGCSTGQVDYPGVTAMAFGRKAKEEEEILLAKQAASSSQKRI